MTLKIDRFPHAVYDQDNRLGYLLDYYPYDSTRGGTLSPHQWRYESWSSQVLDYKEGGKPAIEFFVKPILSLIHYSLNSLFYDSAYLIPVPSSLAHDDPAYSTVPYQRGSKDRKNRDDRNTVFCNLIAAEDTKFRVADILSREESKPEKETWSAKRHAKSMAIRGYGIAAVQDFSGAFILIDDIITHGGTIQGARKVLEDHFSKATVVSLALGHSKDPTQFNPL